VTRRPDRRVERAFTALILAVPLLYLATDVSQAPDVWRYSYRRLAVLVAYAALAAGVLFSYRMKLPGWVAATRTVATIGLVTLLLALLVGEGVLRALDPMPYRELPNVGRHAYDEDLGHVYVPSYSQTLQNREWRQEWRSNAQGVRADRDFGPKPAGVIRIVIVGDSFTVGDQVAVDSTYPGVIQRLFDEDYGPGRIEVVNAGFPAYGTVHEAGWIAKYAGRFEPDIVLVGMTPNDLIENRFPHAVIGFEGALVSRGAVDQLPAFRDRLRWYNLRGHWERSLVHRAIDNAVASASSAPYIHHRAFAVHPDSVALEQFEAAGAYLLEARDAATSRGARFAFITIPFRAQFESMGEGLDPAAFGERWAAFAASHGIPYVDVYPAFRSHPSPESLYWVEDGHCNAAGYALIGRTVYEFFERESEALGLPSPPQ